MGMSRVPKDNDYFFRIDRNVEALSCKARMNSKIHEKSTVPGVDFWSFFVFCFDYRIEILSITESCLAIETLDFRVLARNMTISDRDKTGIPEP